MTSATVTRRCRVTIPKEIREVVGINEGDVVYMKVVEGSKILAEKPNNDVWKDCIGFLPEDYDPSLIRKDSKNRFKNLLKVP